MELLRAALADAFSNRIVLCFRWSKWEGQGWEVLHLYSEFTQDQQIDFGGIIAASVQVHVRIHTITRTQDLHLHLVFSVELF